VRIDRSLTFAWFVSQLQQGNPFSLARLGDGEWRGIFLHVQLLPRKSQAAELPRQSLTGDCNGYRFRPESNRRLHEILQAEKVGYLLGWAEHMTRWYPDLFPQYWEQYQLDRHHWFDLDVFVKENRRGGLSPLLDALRARPLLLVGPRHLQQLVPFPFPKTAHFVEVPLRDCFPELERIEAETRSILSVAKQPTVVSFSAGAGSNLLIDRLYPEFGDRHWLLDLGSLWDPFCGVLSRKYMKSLDIDKWYPKERKA